MSCVPNFMPGNIYIYFFMLRKVNNTPHFKNVAKPYVIIIQHPEPPLQQLTYIIS